MTASGMGAVSAALFTLLSSGDHLVAAEVCYTGTQKLVSFHLPRFGVDVSLVDTTDLEEVAAGDPPRHQGRLHRDAGQSPGLDQRHPEHLRDGSRSGRHAHRRQHLVGARHAEPPRARRGRGDPQRHQVHQRPRRRPGRRHPRQPELPRRRAGMRRRAPGGLHQPLQRLADHAGHRHAAHAHEAALGERPEGGALPGGARAGGAGALPRPRQSPPAPDRQEADARLLGHADLQPGLRAARELRVPEAARAHHARRLTRARPEPASSTSRPSSSSRTWSSCRSRRR